MKKFKILTVFIGALLYAFLFWNEKMGINVLVFTSMIITYLFISKTIEMNSKKQIISALGTLIAAILITVNHSLTSFFVFYFSFAILLGFIFDTEIKTVYYSLIASIVKLFTSQIQSIEHFFSEMKKSKMNGILKFIKIAFLPFIVLIIFHFIFASANPIYKNYSGIIFEKIGLFIEKIISIEFLQQFITFVFGIFIMNFMVYKGISKKFKNKELHKLETIIRKRKKATNSKKLALKTENRIAVLMIVMINLLLLLINIIDINWIWFGEIGNDPATLSQLVHQGTSYLIFSIFLSIAIMLYYFRKNQNFYSKNKSLKITSYIWLSQNMILAISVALRNYHYIANAGLAYKRIGVIFFLLLTIIGLALMFVKIKNKKTMFYLFKKNSWVLYFMFLFIAFFNWDVIIAKYNLSHYEKAGIDRVFLHKLSDKALYVIYQNNNVILNNPAATYKKRVFGNNTDLNYNDNWNYELNNKINKFMKKYQKNSWKSWNLADYKSFKELSKYNQKKFENEGSNPNSF